MADEYWRQEPGEPDWTQENPTKEQCEAWVRARIKAGKQLSADAYGWDIFLHFQRPYHINVCIDLARKVMEEVARD